LGAFIAFLLPFFVPAIFDAAHTVCPPWLGGGKSVLEGGLIAALVCLSITSALGALLVGGTYLVVEHHVLRREP
jgi:TRAP-type mannitol/chloroaromatic compound transport system permease small subunit